MYGNLCHIGRQWVSGQNELTFYYFFCIKGVAQLALQEPNFISQFNFSLFLPDILANKALGERARPCSFFSNLIYLSHLSRPFAYDLVFLFFSFAYDLFFVYVITQDK